MNDHATRVLNYWWALEMFNPRPVPSLGSPGYRRLSDVGSKRTSDWDWENSEPLPWQSMRVLPPPTPRRGKEYVWSHKIYLGLYDRAKVDVMLSELYGGDQEEGERQSQGEGAAASVPVSHEGKIRLGKIVLSSTIWAAARVRSSNPDNFGQPDDFARTEKLVNDRVTAYELERIRTHLKINRTGGDFHNDRDLLKKQRPADEQTILAVLSIIAEVLGASRWWTPDPMPDHAEKNLYSSRIRVTSYQEALDSAEREVPHTDDFMNSFQLEDLGHAFTQAKAGAIPAALKTYLAEKATPSQGDRIDLLANPQRADDMLHPSNIPAGRWPSNPAHSLARAQQFTVNRLLKHHRQTGKVLGVNGPPGTGKTTLIRDVIAGLVTERAQRLCDLEDPAQAFKSDSIPYRFRGTEKKFNPLIDELTGYEMVIASSNNSAVENISTEIPNRETSIDSQNWPDADYFSLLASLLLDRIKNPKKKKGEVTADAWGLISGRFGTRSNRKNYLDPLIYGDTSRWKTTAAGEQEKIRGLSDRLNETSTPVAWQEARAAFRATQDRVEQLRQECLQAHQRREELDRHRKHLEEIADKTAATRAEIADVLADCRATYEEVESSQQKLELAHNKYERQRQLKPGWFENLLSLGAKGMNWREELRMVTEELDSAESIHGAQSGLLRQKEHRHSRLTELLAEQETDISHLEQQISTCELEVEADRKKYGSCHPDEQDLRTRELVAPWLTEDFNRARTDLFLAALDLHKAFLHSQETHMYAKLKCAVSVILNEAEDPSPEYRQAAWQVFFMAVPTISTTFASAPNMFTGLGKDTFGWLLVDEAGQANPQEAVGALGRAKNILAVGDPLQLEPISNVPDKARQYMADYYGLTDEWKPLPASIQTIADRVAHYGAYLGSGDSRRWVSAPLRVHRRCESPMFEISNRVAYDGMMISATVPSESWHRQGRQVFRSMWRNTDFRDPVRKLQEHDFERFTDLMAYLAERGVSPEDVIAISPFREIADRLQRERKKYPGLRAGTVHTAQGREAEVVVLVLGTAENADGSRRWAAQTPNLVNVAASRAKRRLYVLGNIGKWGSLPYFNTMLGELEKGQTGQGVSSGSGS